MSENAREPITLAEQQEVCGQDLVELLYLKVKENGRVDTRWGDKTALGLFLTVKRVLDGLETID